MANHQGGQHQGEIAIRGPIFHKFPFRKPVAHGLVLGEACGTGQRRSASGELTTRIFALTIAHEFLDELLGIGTEESLRIPCHC
jgi:hypothetical protein